MTHGYTILMWLLSFGVFIFLQSLFIHGIKGGMDGTTVTLPNGKTKDGEMILYPFYKWLMEKGTANRVYYTGQQFKDLMEKLYVVYKMMPGKYDPESPTTYIYLNADDEVEMMKQMSFILNKEIGVDITMVGRQAWFYKEYDNYKRSKWIRKPLGGCIKCMASAWTLPVFWPVAIFLFGFQWWLVPLYIFNIACVSYMNVLIFKK